MLHKIFEWFYLRKRSSFGKYNRKMEIRTNDRDLIHYFHDFGGSTRNSRRSYWLYRKIFKIIVWVVFLLFAFWFSVESYKGLIIYD